MTWKAVNIIGVAKMKKLSTLGLIALSAFTIVTGSSTIFPGITTRTVSASTKIIKKDTIKKSHKAILKN